MSEELADSARCNILKCFVYEAKRRGESNMAAILEFEQQCESGEYETELDNPAGGLTVLRATIRSLGFNWRKDYTTMTP